MAVFYVLIGTQCNWNFEKKILRLMWKTRELYVSFTWFCLHFEHSAKSDQLS